jgi:hypothetical protein
MSEHMGTQEEFDYPAGTVLRVRALVPIRYGSRVLMRKGDITTGTVNHRDGYAVTLHCKATVPGRQDEIAWSVVRWDLALLGVVLS